MVHHLTTDRLLLRPYKRTDACRVQALAGEREVAETTLAIPHPYSIEAAESWIENHAKLIENGEAYPFAMVLRDDNLLIGTMTIRTDYQHNKGELAYWVGKDYWGQGYATEAAKRITQFGFDELTLNRVFAQAMSRNKGSTKVMEKVGMSYEGTLKQELFHWGKYEDVDVYGLLRSAYEQSAENYQYDSLWSK